MSRLVLNDRELFGLVKRILGDGHAETILDWMSYAPSFGDINQNDVSSKDLGYRDYALRLRNFTHRSGTVETADLQLWRKSKFFGKKENMEIVRSLLQIITSRYPSTVPTAYSVRHGHHWNFGYSRKIEHDPGDFIGWGSEALLAYDPNSSGQTNRNETNVRNDFIVFRFRRKYVSAQSQ